jgi:hypothetical protein
VLPAALFLLLAVGPLRVAFDGEIDVPHDRARGVPVHVDKPSYVDVEFSAKGSGSVELRSALMTVASVNAYQQGKPHQVLASAPDASRGSFRRLLMQPGDYYVLLDHRAKESVKVQVRVSLAEDPALPGSVPPARRRAVVAASVAGFLIAAAWSGLRIRRAWTAGSVD